jgi:hypothetical protein
MMQEPIEIKKQFEDALKVTDKYIGLEIKLQSRGNGR